MDSQEFERDLIQSLKAMDFGAMDAPAQLVVLRVILSGLDEVSVDEDVNFIQDTGSGVITVSYDPFMTGILWFHYPDWHASRYTREQLCGTFWGRFKASIKEDREAGSLWMRWALLFLIAASVASLINVILVSIFSKA